jgi:hypothetical protein
MINNILKELNRLIDILQEGKKIKGFKLSLYEIQELITVRNELVKYGKSETINDKVNKICLYCGIKTRTKGIGYQILKEASF